MKGSERNGGFTLIEMLICVVIIGILAAIALPHFTSVKESTFDASAKSDLRNAMTAQEAHYSDFQEYASDVADLAEFVPSIDVTITVEEGDIGRFVMTAQHGLGKCWEVDSNDGVIVLRGDAC
jgi:prepilin-type N-terminal cleavage/methylation domain-containing protein